MEKTLFSITTSFQLCSKYRGESTPTTSSFKVKIIFRTKTIIEENFKTYTN